MGNSGVRRCFSSASAGGGGGGGRRRRNSECEILTFCACVFCVKIMVVSSVKMTTMVFLSVFLFVTASAFGKIGRDGR